MTSLVRPLRLLQAVGVVLLAGLADGDRGGLIALLVVAAGGLAALLWRLPTLQRSRLVADGETDRSSGFPTYTSLYAGIVVAAGSQRNADLALVPALRRVVLTQIDEVGAQDVRIRLGEQWWGLLDPSRPISANSSSGGLNARALDDLFARLEARPR